MRTISYKLDDLKKVVIPIGYEGENNHTRVIIDAGEVFKQYPEAAVALTVQPPKGTMYPAIVTRDGDAVTWDVKDSDCASNGNGEAQFTFTNGTVVVKSVVTKIKVQRSLHTEGPAPDPILSWLDNAEEVLDDLAAMDNIAKTAEAGDIGKALSPKTVENGVVTEWQYVEPGAGTEDYTDLENKPSIGGVTLSGDKSLTDLGIASADSVSELSGDVSDVKNDIQGLDENAVQYVLARKFNVGDNLLTNETTFTGAGWSGSLTNGFTHVTGNTDPLVFEVSTEEDQSYIIDFDYSGTIVGDEMYVSIGDTYKVDVYHGAIRPFVGIISDGGYLKLFCKSTYTGTITNLKIRPVLESGGTEVIFECAEVTNGQNPYEISAWHNVAIGRDALSKNVNGTRTVAIGDRALEKMVTGHRNIAIGSYAMPFVKEGDCNVSIGADTLYNFNNADVNGKAYDNIAIGKGTLRPGATEEYTIKKNIAIGKGAMAECDGNSEQNISIGCRAGANAGDKCVYIGQDAGYYYKGDENVIIGDNAGNTLYHSGQRNVFIGAMARVEIDGASAQFPKSVNNCVIIGAYTKGTESNSIYIGRSVHTKVVIAGKTINFNQDGTVTWS